jgi:hypothetical protein
MTTRTAFLGSLCAAVFLFSSGVRAEPAADNRGGAVPAPLVPWVPWVLADAPEHLCAVSGDRTLCDWPGKLDLTLDAHGGRFEQRVLLDRARAFALPGSAEAWPLAVLVDGKAAAVLDQGGAPSAMLGAGEHRIEGRFEWRALPERLAVPVQTAYVALRVNGAEVAFPKRDEQGQLWLLAAAAGDAQGEQVELGVSRKIEDGVPVIITTRIDLHVSGRAREVALGRVLLDGTAPLALASELPARLEANGELRLQVRAGKYRVEVRARSIAAPDQLAYRGAGASWPESETWVWQADEALRQVEVSGAPAIDPARTELDADWRNLPAFVLHAGTALHFTTTRRGETSPPPNRMTLARELWLDLDGDGYTVRDSIRAELRSGFRLDLLAGELGHVSAGGEDLLITKPHGKKAAGVELRAADQQLVAEWRAERPLSQLPAVGWSEDAQSLTTTLHLGPGFSLFAASGVDNVSQTWLQDWDLFDFFFVLLIAIAVGRLAGRPYALLALAALVVCHEEADAPRAVWFTLLAAIALLRVLPAGWFRNLVRVGYVLTIVSLLVISVPFAVQQIRRALYPQLDDAGAGWIGATNPFAKMDFAGPLEAPAAPPPAPAAPTDAPQVDVDQLARGGAVSGVGSKSKVAERYDSSVAQQRQWAEPSSKTRRALQQDPEATVQMGPGVPTWSWRTWQLRWSGSVDKAHALKLYLLTPLHNRMLALLRVLLLAALIAVLLRRATPGRDRPGRDDREAPAASSTPAPAMAALLFVLAAAAVLAGPRVARADLPDAALLDQLRARLTKPAECRPSCASIDTLAMDVSDAGLVLTASVHAGERTSVRLPGPAATWVPSAVTLDHHADAPVVLLEDGFLNVRVEPGVHVIEARGPLPPTDTLTLAFADLPHHASVHAQGFKVDGVREDGRVEAAVQLSRMLSVELGKPLERAALPPWLLLERQIELGPSWQVHTRLSRITPSGSPIMVRVPLLAGESVTDSAHEVVAGELQVSFGRDDSVVEWDSRLATSARLGLIASKDKPWSERWSLLCGPIWHCELSGLTPTHYLQQQRFEPTFAPWPGERVDVSVTRPPPAAGQSVAIDSADLDVTPGTRLLKATLALGVRSSRGASQHVRLPQGARVQQLVIDGQERPLRIENSELAFTLDPGRHAVRLQWQEGVPIGASMRVPAVELKHASANTQVVVHVPQDRWLLWASGPSWGPAVLFWGYLLLVLGAGVLLGRVRNSPLRTWQWVLLALGLTQVPAPAALCVVSWFFVMAYRARMPEQTRWLHNLAQLALALWTFVALGSLYDAVQAGLLVHPDMQVAGAGSNAFELHWYEDRSSGALPTPVLWTAPLWAWRVLMLIWSLWLAASLVRWLPWAFGCYRQGGLWKKGVPKPKRAPVPPFPPPAAPPPTPSANP